MKYKNIIISSLLPLLLSGCNVSVYTPVDGDVASWSQKEVINYMLNYERNETSLDGVSFVDDSLLFTQQDVSESGEVVPPSSNPERSGYSFEGWFIDEEATTLFDFANTKVHKSTILYAGWGKDSEGDDDYVEPDYEPESNIDDSLINIAKVDGVLNFPITTNFVLLPTGAIKRLEANIDDVSFAINYKKHTNTSLNEATYNVTTKKISLSFVKGSESYNEEISIIDNSTNLAMNNANYERLASKYEEEDKNATNYRVMLAGSSSIEYWKDYEKALSPIKAYSHGIGGTTTTDWKDKLLDRLVVPYSPKLMVIYAGINDVINTSKETSAIINDTKALLDTAHNKMPDMKIIYILLNKLPGVYLNKAETIQYIDDNIVEYAKTQSWLSTVDAGAPLMKNNGEANGAYFRLDNLHLSEYGYVLWGKAIKNAIMDVLG